MCRIPYRPVAALFLFWAATLAFAQKSPPAGKVPTPLSTAIPSTTASIPAAPAAVGTTTTVSGTAAASTSAQPGAQAAAAASSPSSASSGGATAVASGQSPQTASEPDAVPPKTDAADEEADLVARTLALDIRTASFYELVDWARSLDLPDSGSAADIRSRLYAKLGIKAPRTAGESSRVITIEHADSAEYFSVGEDSANIIRLSGGVSLTVAEADSGSSHTISARDIVYDRARNAVSARGAVRYKKESSGSLEEFYGETLDVDLDDWTGVFLDGTLRRQGSDVGEGERGLAFSGENILRRSGKLVVLEGGIVTACDEEDPHFSIKAKKMWLLSDEEWAVSDALVYLGEVPVFWLPFFYYPGEELAFHPVLGTRPREGRFVQTTTYLIGEKPEKKGTTGIFRSTETASKKEVRGVFLRRVDGTPSRTLGNSLKVLADAYSNLGAFLGIQGSFTKKGILERAEFFAGAGLSRSVFPITTTTGSRTSTSYTPFISDGLYASQWNGSSFSGLDLPFRYGLELAGSLRSGIVGASFELPLYSDPYFSSDFRNRSEDMEWLKFGSLTSDDTSLTATTTSTASMRSNLTQKLGLTLSYRPAFLEPYLSAIEFSRLALSLSWLSKAATRMAGETYTLYAYKPDRYFFYPDQFKPVDAALSLRGNLIKIPSVTPALMNSGLSAERAALAKTPGERMTEGLSARAPWDEVASAEEKPQEEGAAAPVSPVPSPETPSLAGAARVEAPLADARSERVFVDLASTFRLPARVPSSTTSRLRRPFGLSVDWALTPTYLIEDRYKETEVKIPDEIKFDPIYSLASHRLAGSLTAQATFYEDYLSTALSLSYSEQDQNRVYTTTAKENIDKERIKGYKLADAQFKAEKIIGSLKLTARPFADLWLLSPTSLGYTLDTILYGKAFESYDSATETAVYKTTEFEWNKEAITAQSLSGSLGLRTGSRTQSLGLTIGIPPAKESYGGTVGLNAGLGLWSSTFGFQGRAYKDLEKSETELQWDPMVATLTGAGPLGFAMSARGGWDVKKSRIDTLSSSLTLSWVTAALSAKRTKLYKPEINTGWVAYGEEDLYPTDFSAAIKGELKTPTTANPALSSSLNLSYTQNLIRYSESILSFNLGFALKLTDQISLSVSSLSQNQSAWLYWPKILSNDQSLSIQGIDIFTDIWESFAFWDDTLRAKSRFKLKSLSFKVSRELHDWDFSLELTEAPMRDSKTKKYYLDTSFTILVAWRDIPEIKSKIKGEVDSEGVLDLSY